MCSWYGQQFSQAYHGKTWGRYEFDFCIVLGTLVAGSGEIRIEKRKGEHNTADIGTKAVSAPVLMKHLKTLKIE